jgi:hypothetical protein
MEFSLIMYLCTLSAFSCNRRLRKKNLKKKLFSTPHSFSVTFFIPFGLRPFFILLKIKEPKKIGVPYSNQDLRVTQDCGSFVQS